MIYKYNRIYICTLFSLKNYQKHFMPPHLNGKIHQISHFIPFVENHHANYRHRPPPCPPQIIAHARKKLLHL
ncbi:hypothetical protein [Moraxella lacunata]|uniref:hypothetical protein n=1 Tax=Moraxella lacunata TaxID=477 RepID=UPI003EDF4C13